jgi:glucose-6-phosphate isomerase
MTVQTKEVAVVFDPLAGMIEGVPTTERHLSDLSNSFADQVAYQRALAQGDPVVYTLSSMQPAQGKGQLHCGLGKIMPGRIGTEYFLTKGHLHAWQPAAEIYVGLSGRGVMLLENHTNQESKLIPLLPYSLIYVPGFTAHRTINTGVVPLTYLGIYPAEAGHDYATITQRNFSKVVVAVNGKPTLLDRTEFLVSVRDGS